MKNTTVKMIVALVIAVLSSMAQAAGNADEGKKKAETCKACHGEGGAKPIMPEYPVLAGQHEDYLVAALSQYKTGKRQNPIMKGFAAALSPQDIRDLAAYLSSQKSALKSKY
ncbi:MAG: cytochrome c [Pseudomonadota bacterium]